MLHEYENEIGDFSLSGLTLIKTKGPNVFVTDDDSVMPSTLARQENQQK